MDRLPPEIILQIYYNLDVRNIYFLSSVNRRTYQIYLSHSRNIFSHLSIRDNTGVKAHNLLGYFRKSIVHFKKIETDDHDINKIRGFLSLFSQSVYNHTLLSYIRSNVDFSRILNDPFNYKNLKTLSILVNSGVICSDVARDLIIRNMDIEDISELCENLKGVVLNNSVNAIFHRIGIEILNENINDVTRIILITKPYLKTVDPSILNTNITKINDICEYINFHHNVDFCNLIIE